MTIFLLSPLVIGVLLLGGWGITTGRAAEACCRRCRYPAAGLRDPVCPECGSDLRARGTLEPGDRYLLKPSRSVAAVCRTLLVIAVSLLLVAAARENIPLVHSTATATAHSRSGLFSELAIEARGSAPAVHRSQRSQHWMTQRVVRTPATVHLTGPSRTVSLRVTALGDRIAFDSPTGRISDAGGLTTEHVLQWLRAAGIDTTSEAARHQATLEAGAIRTLVTNVVAGTRDFKDRAPSGALSGLSMVEIKTSRRLAIDSAHVSIIGIAAAATWFCLIRQLRTWGPAAGPVSPPPSSANDSGGHQARSRPGESPDTPLAIKPPAG